jgi:hypothetical protein
MKAIRDMGPPGEGPICPRPFYRVKVLASTKDISPVSCFL